MTTTTELMTQNPKSFFRSTLTVIAYLAIPAQLLFLFILLTNKWSRPTLFVTHIESEFFLYLFAFIGCVALGIIAAAISRQWIALVVHALIPTSLVALVVASFAMALNKPKPKFDAKDYQHLVGRDIREVKAELAANSSFSYGRGSGQPPYKSLWLRGMNIIANEDDNIIFKVEANRRE